MVNRVLLGQMFDTFGLRVTLPTGEVTNDAINPGLVSFDSRWVNTGKIWITGRTTNIVTESGGFLTTAVAKVNLGYTPSASTPPMVYMLAQRTSTAYTSGTPNDTLAVIPADSIYINGSVAEGGFTGYSEEMFSYVSYLVTRPFE